MGKRLSRYLTKQMANKHTKNCATSLAIREMQIKDMMRYHYILTQMSKIRNTDSIKC